MTIVLNAVTHGMAAASETKSGEFAPSARFPKAIWCQQLSPDSGSGARLGPFESQVAAAGLEAGYLFSFNGHQASLSARIYREFGAAARLEGTGGFLALGIPLWAPPAAAGTTGAAASKSG